MTGQDAFFLNVSQSLTGRSWLSRLDDAGTRMSAAIAQRAGVSEILARVLAARGVEPDEIDAYLHPTLRDLMPDPSILTSLNAAARRIADAVVARESVGLFGDYDVDGAASAALMVRYFRALGVEPTVHIPDRIFEGYGPNINAIDRLIDGGATLLVMLDCGTASPEPLAHARERGAEIIVIDHHLSDAVPDAALAVVNPNRGDDISGLGNLCAAGVTFMVLVAVNRELRARGHADLPDLLMLADLVCLATICDVVPLQGLNRAFVARGLEIMQGGGNPGISALSLAARINGPLTPYHLGFLIGPRINAGGRIGDAALGARLLASNDPSEVSALAAQLDILNAERQRIEVEAVEQAVAAADAEVGDGDGPPVFVLASQEWHQGVVGLIAARLKERYGRPAFAIALGKNGIGTGSGRSIAGVDLGNAVIGAVKEGLLVKGGGHAMAAGITLKQGDLGRFRAYLSDKLSEPVRKSTEKSQIRIDGALSARGATVDLILALEEAGPFGAGNPGPIFAFPAHLPKYAQIVGSGGHIRFTLEGGDGGRLKAIAFRASDGPLGKSLLDPGDERPRHFAGTLSINHWQGRREPQLRLLDIAEPDAGNPD